MKYIMVVTMDDDFAGAVRPEGGWYGHFGASRGARANHTPLGLPRIGGQRSIRKMEPQLSYCPPMAELLGVAATRNVLSQFQLRPCGALVPTVFDAGDQHRLSIVSVTMSTRCEVRARRRLKQQCFWCVRVSSLYM